jgi:hypothetical protein
VRTWEREAPLLVRSFVEQQIDPDLGIVRGVKPLDKIIKSGFIRLGTFMRLGI